ncbi:MAG: hypothetical protein AAF585_12875 [Verrucomicrobiota bacterium]
MTDQWFEIETSKGTPAVLNYRGRVDPEIVEKILSGELTEGWLTIRNVYYVEEQPAETQQYLDVCIRKFGRDGAFVNMSGVKHLRIEHIVSISPMERPDRDDDFTPGGIGLS